MIIKRFVFKDVIVTYFELSNKKELIFKKIEPKVEPTFLDFNLCSLLFISSIKNNGDEITLQIKGMNKSYNMISYIRKEDSKLYFCSNIEDNERKEKPSFSQTTKINDKVYTSSIDVESKKVEDIFNSFIDKSIQNDSFIRLCATKNNYVGILIEHISSKSDTFYSELKKEKPLNIYNNLKKDTFFNNKIESSDEINVEYKCVCSKEKCVELVSSLLKSGPKIDIEKDIKLSCPICGKVYKISKEDLK